MTQYFPFDPNPRAPAEPPPAGACDAQFHVFGPRERYPVRPDAGYEMPHATFEEAMRMHRTLGITRGVIVQPTTYGTDNSAMLDALALAGPGYRGCTIGKTLDTASEAELQRLHDAGVRGARFNFLRSLNMMPTPEALANSAARLRELGWYMKIQPGNEGILDAVALYEDLDIPVLIDHMGRPDLSEGLDGPTVRKVIELLGRGNFWLMLSNGHKLSRQGAPWDDAVPLAQAYIQAAPDRVVWSTDWPHPVSTRQPPNDGDLLELFYRYAPDADTRRRVLVDNPAALFGFGPVGA